MKKSSGTSFDGGDVPDMKGINENCSSSSLDEEGVSRLPPPPPLPAKDPNLIPFIFDTDSYKASHFLQYPPKTSYTHFYGESRGGKFDSTVFFGLQYYLKHYLSGRTVTEQQVEDAAVFYQKQGVPFNKEGWMHIAKDLNGKLPLEIKAVPEGLVVPVKNVLFTIESTDEQSFWLPGWIETSLLRSVWYPTTVATLSKYCRDLIYSYLQKTADDPDSEIQFKLHDFGARGVSSQESACIGGAAHLVNFLGSDTVAGVYLANKYYDCEMAGFSIPAAEHSTITSWGDEHEVDAFRNMLTQFAKPGSLVAVVSDSYDLSNAVSNLWGEQLRQQVIESGATVIIRPDSGDPVSIVNETVKTLEAKFGVLENSKGYKVLNNVKVIQGDGINHDTIGAILENLEQDNFSASNIGFGMGGGLLQQVNRDTQAFAMKLSCAQIDGDFRGICKCPITDPGKASRKGRLALYFAEGTGKYRTISQEQLSTGEKELEQDEVPVLRTVFKDGELLVETNFEEVRKLALSGHVSKRVV